MNTQITVSDFELKQICKGISNIQKQKEKGNITYNEAGDCLRAVIRYAENVLEILFNKNNG